MYVVIDEFEDDAKKKKNPLDLVNVVVDVRHAELRDADHRVRLPAARLPVRKYTCCAVCNFSVVIMEVVLLLQQYCS